MMYAGSILFVLVAIIAPLVFFALHEPASCFDGIQNQNETAIDRGGPCQLLDEQYLQPHAVLWARSFLVREGFYNAVAYIENPNTSAGVYSAAYQFKLYDKDNILIAERYGSVPLFPGKVFPIFETRIDTGERIPARTFFAFVDDLVWERMENPTAGIRIKGERFTQGNTAPRVDAILENTNVRTKDDVVVIATVFDSDGNAVGSSRTIVETIAGGAEQQIVFTWPAPFGTPVTRVDIVPLALPENPR